MIMTLPGTNESIKLLYNNIMKKNLILLFLIAVTLTSCGAAGQSAADRVGPTGDGYVFTDAEVSSYSFTSQMLEGRIPGLEVTPMGLSIRGSGIPPLIVYDGVRLYDIDNIPPIEIYSVRIRTTEAMALYGMEAEGGAVEVTSRYAHNQQEMENLKRKAKKAFKARAAEKEAETAK